jgi:copper(I)-binding protein
MMNNCRVMLVLGWVICLAGRASAGDVAGLKVSEGWVRAVPGSVGDSAAFMVLSNTGDTALRLTGATTQIAGMAMPMETTRKMVDRVEALGMKEVDFIEIPAHGEVRLKPGGDHLMLMGLTEHPQPGAMVTIMLQIEPGHRTLTVTMPARIDG